MSGYRDTIDSVARNHARHAEYTKADRAYNKDYGSHADYRDGYQQGYEAGYETGYDRKSFESTLPTGLKKRGAIANNEPIASKETTTTVTAPIKDPEYSDSNGTSQTVKVAHKSDTEPVSAASSYQATTGAVIIIPRDIDLIIELQEDLNTEQSREGEKFTAKVVSPSELAGATIEGRVAKILKPGRIKRRSEMLLSFDRIILNDNRWSNFAATMTEVMAVKGDNIKRVDNEGTAIGQSSLKGDLIKVGATTGTGTVIGAVAGGPVGAAVGASVGAAFGVGAIVIERGKHVRLNRNQQIRIKTSYETQIR